MAIKTYIVDGIKVKVDEDVFEDFEVLEIFAEMQTPLPPAKLEDGKTDNPEYIAKVGQQTTKMVRFVHLLLGTEKEKVFDALRNRNKGILKTEAIFDFLSKIMEKNNKAKK